MNNRFNKILLLILAINFFMPFISLSIYNAQENSNVNLIQENIKTIKNETIVDSIQKTKSVEDLNTEEISFQIKDIDETQRREVKNPLSSEIGVSTAVDENKVNAKAGERELIVASPKTSDVQKYYITVDGSLVDENQKTTSNVVNEIEVYNNKIISTDEGIIQTLGGYNKTLYMYDSLEETNNVENGIPLSGGAFDAKYLSTEQYNENYFAHVQISGREGYINIKDVQVIPSSIIKAQSFYENIDGDWVYNSAIDPLFSNEYEQNAIGTAPEWAVQGVKYYSYDDVNYFENNIIKEQTSTKEYYSYFQNMPFTSTADYNASQYQNYLKSVGKTTSEYYYATSSFIDAQNLESVNSLFLFAMANHEGAYGTSYYSKTCNNFFGWGAYDSDPDNACKSYGWPTPRDGILSQAMRIKQLWADLIDWRWAGAQVGNKSHGMNVYYATDPNWGKGIATHMYNTDKYLGQKENNKYRIYEIKNEEPVYTSSSLSSTLKLTNSSTTYRMKRANGNPRVIVTADSSKSFEFQLPTPKNISNSTTCKFSDANKGSYPNFDATYTRSVSKGIGSFACDYSSWTGQQNWYPKKDASGNVTYNVIAGNSITSPGSNNTEHKIRTSLKKVELQSEGIYLEGVGYITNVSQDKPSDVSHKIKIKSDNGENLKEVNAKSIDKPSIMNNYETSGYSYDSGYFSALVPYEIINSGYNNVYLEVTAGGYKKEEKINTSLNKKIKYVKENKIEVYKNSENRLRFKKTLREGKIITSTKKASLNGSKLHLEGIGYMTEMYQKETTRVQHYLEFVDYNKDNIVKSYAVGASPRPSLMDKYESNGLQYDSGYFATYNYKGINISDLPKGKYKIYLKENTAGRTDREWLNGASLPKDQSNLSSNSDGKKYKLYMNSNKRLIMEVS